MLSHGQLDFVGITQGLTFILSEREALSRLDLTLIYVYTYYTYMLLLRMTKWPEFSW